MRGLWIRERLIMLIFILNFLSGKHLPFAPSPVEEKKASFKTWSSGREKRTKQCIYNFLSPNVSPVLVMLVYGQVVTRFTSYAHISGVISLLHLCVRYSLKIIALRFTTLASDEGHMPPKQLLFVLRKHIIFLAIKLKCHFQFFCLWGSPVFWKKLHITKTIQFVLFWNYTEMLTLTS